MGRRGGRSLSEPSPTPEYPNCLRPSFSRSFPISPALCFFSLPHLGDWQREFSQERRREGKKDKKRIPSYVEVRSNAGEHSRYSRCVNRTGIRCVILNCTCYKPLEIRTQLTRSSLECLYHLDSDRLSNHFEHARKIRITSSMKFKFRNSWKSTFFLLLSWKLKLDNLLDSFMRYWQLSSRFEFNLDFQSRRRLTFQERNVGFTVRRCSSSYKISPGYFRFRVIGGSDRSTGIIRPDDGGLYELESNRKPPVPNENLLISETSETGEFLFGFFRWEYIARAVEMARVNGWNGDLKCGEFPIFRLLSEITDHSLFFCVSSIAGAFLFFFLFLQLYLRRGDFSGRSGDAVRIFRIRRVVGYEIPYRRIEIYSVEFFFFFLLKKINELSPCMNINLFKNTSSNKNFGGLLGKQQRELHQSDF